MPLPKLNTTRKNIQPIAQQVTLDLSDWRLDRPQEGSRTMVLTSYRTIEYCVFQGGFHRIEGMATRNKVLNEYECVAWIYKDELLKAMIGATR